MLSNPRSVLPLRLSWVLATLLSLAFFVSGVIQQADKFSHGGVLGIWMASQARQTTILAVVPGLSGERAGLQPGDFIVSRSAARDPQSGNWSMHVIYRDRSGKVHDVVIETAPPEHLPFNIPASFFGWVSAMIDLLFFLAFIMVGTLIVWRAGKENDRSARRFALVAAFLLLLTAVRIPPEIHLLLSLQPNGSLLDPLLGLFGYTIFPLFLSLFPNGRWAPRSIWIYPLVSAAYGCAVLLFSWQPFSNPLLISMVDLTITGVGIAAQAYRYRFVSTQQERQQTKWALSGIGTAFVLYYLLQFADTLSWIPALFPTLRLSASASYLYILFWPQLSTLALLFVPAALAISILRFRLWDIDLIVRRTLAYTLATSLLAGMYFFLVIVLQQMFRLLTGQSSSLAIILSTLAISLLFTPVRRGVQSAIDRRFYRSQYNAAQTLERFSGALRSEMDLDRLSGELVEVVQETLHPEPVSLWIIPVRKSGSLNKTPNAP